MKIRTSRTEIFHLLRAWVAISIAFSVLLGGLGSVQKFIATFLVAALTVGIGFLFHELSHKIVAQRYGCFAEFRASDPMLLLAIAMSFLGFVFAAPGAVMIAGHVNRKENGIISSAGIVMNMFLVVVFILLGLAFGYNSIFSIGAQINATLAAFNLIPVWNLDGSKVLSWNIAVYVLLAIAAAGLYFIAPVAFSWINVHGGLL